MESKSRNVHEVESESHKEQLYRMGTCKRGKGGKLLCNFEPVEPDTLENVQDETDILDADLIEGDDLNTDEDVDSDSDKEEE